jgi:hypothetical protein
MTARYVVFDRFAYTATHLRPKSTAINPRYQVLDVVEHEVVDEFTTKYIAQLTARDLNNANTP